MTNQKEYDFIEMGKRCAIERMENLVAMADKIESEYGQDARLEFESGIALVVPVYSHTMFANKKIARGEIEQGASKIFGVSNLINNSYLSEDGYGSKKRPYYPEEEKGSKSK